MLQNLTFITTYHITQESTCLEPQTYMVFWSTPWSQPRLSSRIGEHLVLELQVLDF